MNQKRILGKIFFLEEDSMDEWNPVVNIDISGVNHTDHNTAWERYKSPCKLHVYDFKNKKELIWIV